MCKDSNFAQILKKKCLKSNRIKIKWVETAMRRHPFGDSYELLSQIKLNIVPEASVIEVRLV